MVLDARGEVYDVVDMDSRLCLFINARLDRDTIPKGLYCYDVRDSDSLDGSFAELKTFVPDNHSGTLISWEEITLNGQGSYYPREEPYFTGIHLSLKEYVQASREELEEAIAMLDPELSL